MPEIAEVRLTAEWVTQINAQRTITAVEYGKFNKLKHLEPLEVVGQTLSATSRGKELKLQLGSHSVVLTLGMTGSFRDFTEQPTQSNVAWTHSHVKFQMSDGAWFTWCDVRRFGRSQGTDWSEKRGPDLLDEPRKFKANILTNLHHRDFQKPAHELLMNQQWFNGIGNYLRAEILGKWNVNPFQPMVAIVSEAFLDHLISLVKQAYQLRGGPLYNWMGANVEISLANRAWEDWMQYYGQRAKMLDKQKRTFWYDKKWEHYLTKL